MGRESPGRAGSRFLGRRGAVLVGESSSLGRAAVALVWLYHGLWCKLLRGCPGQAAIVDAVPGLAGTPAAAALFALGLLETGLAVWVMSRRAPWRAALAQTVLLVAMNGGGLWWGRAHIAEPGAMIVQNIAFLALVWLVARDASSGVGASAATPWVGGRFDDRGGPAELLFGRMHEDWGVEAEAFAPGARVFCIASAGCTAIALADRGHDVTAVDVNPAQMAYVRDRLAGGTCRQGRADRGLAFTRRLAPLVGWTGLRPFLELTDPGEQVRFWDSRLDTWRLRWALRFALHPWMLGFAYRPELVRALPAGFADLLVERLRRGLGSHPNRTNPYAWRLFLGEAPLSQEPPEKARGTIALACADAASFLETGPAAAFGGFSLSNILDGASPAYRERLRAAVRRAAAPGARVVLRSFAQSTGAGDEEGRRAIVRSSGAACG